MRALRVDPPATKDGLLQLVEKAGKLLTMDTLDPVAGFLASLKEYVLSTCGPNSVGHFLLKGRVHWVFTLVVRLKQLTFQCLVTKYNMRLDTVSSLEISGHPFYPKLSMHDQTLVMNIGHSNDLVPAATTFWLLDSVSIGVFMAVYLLTEEKNGALQEKFLESHAAAIAEVHPFCVPSTGLSDPCLAEFAGLRSTGPRPEQVPPLPGLPGGV